MDAIELWYNPSCSKCRATLERIEAAGIPVEIYAYLETPPDRDRLEAVLRRLDLTDSPAALARTGDDAWRAAGLDEADAEGVRAALLATPRLIQRPIAVWRDRAVICRPPELVDPLLDAVRAAAD